MTTKQKCPSCDGTGFVTFNSEFGRFDDYCPSCDGYGVSA